MPANLIFDMPKVDNQRTENMNGEQLAAYLKAIDEGPDQNAAALLRLALFTGMRRGALFALRWDDVDFEHKIISLRGDAAKSGKTAHLPRSHIKSRLQGNFLKRRE